MLGTIGGVTAPELTVLFWVLKILTTGTSAAPSSAVGPEPPPSTDGGRPAARSGVGRLETRTQREARHSLSGRAGGQHLVQLDATPFETES